MRVMDVAPWLWHSLSPHSVCKKSPNLLAALLSLLELNLKQWQKAVQPCAGKGRFPGEVRPKKECIKSCETCFANTLNLNDKGPSLKWICFPKSYSPLATWPWLRISPQSSLLSIIWSLLPDNDGWALPVFLCKLNPIKAHWGKGSWAFSCERSATSPPQVDHVLVDLFSSVVAGGGGGGGLQAEPPALRDLSCELVHKGWALIPPYNRSLPWLSWKLRSFQTPSKFHYYLHCAISRFWQTEKRDQKWPN